MRHSPEGVCLRVLSLSLIHILKEASTKEKYVLEPTAVTEEKPYEVAVLDFGVKTNILRCLQVRNCRLTVYPYGTPAAEILQENPDGIFPVSYTHLDVYKRQASVSRDRKV